jgi:dTDP-4-amino-4,6-dideoxygalactose transaminase
MDIPRWPVYGERERELLEEVLASGVWGGFNEIVVRFEEVFAAFQQCLHGISAFNGTVTLETALEVGGIRPGDEVIVPAISFISTATAVSRLGAVPVFVDIDPETFNLDPERAAAAVTRRTRAILVVHFGGLMADMDRFTRLAAERELLLIEDAAHAHGSEWGGSRAGSFGLAGSFSFQNSKVMTAGEGGLLTTNDDGFAERARSFINQGRQAGAGWFHHYSLGTNLRMTAFQAAVLLAQLERLPEQISTREANAHRLRAALAGVPGLQFQQAPAQATAHSWYLLLGRVDAAKFGKTRDQLHWQLKTAGVPCTPFYPHPLYGNPMYKDGRCRVMPCPVAEECVRDSFWLPHRVLLAEPDTIEAIAEVFSGKTPLLGESHAS